MITQLHVHSQFRAAPLLTLAERYRTRAVYPPELLAINNIATATTVYSVRRRIDSAAPHLIKFFNLLPFDVKPALRPGTPSQQADQIRQWMNGVGRGEILNCTSLDLSHSPFSPSNLVLTELPPEIGLFKNLKELDINNNSLTTLPAEVRNLRALGNLNLNKNLIETFPESIIHLQNLTILSLGDNSIRTIPPTISNLTNLEGLFLSNNQLQILPLEFWDLTKLKHLFLDKNQIHTLPPEIGNLSNLTDLDLSGNHLRSLPTEITHLKVLESFTCSGNEDFDAKDLLFKMLVTCLQNKPEMAYSSLQGLSDAKKQEACALAVKHNFTLMSRLPGDLFPYYSVICTHSDKKNDLHNYLMSIHGPVPITTLASWSQQLDREMIETCCRACDFWTQTLSREQFLWVLEQHIFTKIFDLPAPHLRASLIESAEMIATNPNNYLGLNLCDELPWPQVLKLPLASLESQGVYLMPNAEQPFVSLLGAIEKNKNKIRETKNFIPFLETLELFSRNTLLNAEQKNLVVQELCQEPTQFLMKMGQLGVILKCQQDSLLQSTENLRLGLKALAEKSFQNILFSQTPLDINKYIEIFGSYRQPDAMINYAASLATLKNPLLLQSLAAHISSVLDKTYQHARYATENNPHLQKIQREYPNVFEQWQQNIENMPIEKLLVNTSIENQQQETLHAWLYEKLLTDKHLGNMDNYPYLKEHLEGDVQAFHHLKINLQTKGMDKNLQQQLALQNKICQLASSTGPDSLRLLKELHKNTLISSDFRMDLENKILQLEEMTKELESYFVSLTDNPQDLFLMGSEGQKSCQRIEGGSPNRNQGLLGTLHNGQTRIIKVPDNQGQIIARSLLRLLWAGDRPVLFLERYYSNNPNPRIKAAIQKMAVLCAKNLKCPLTSFDPQYPLYGKRLESLRGSAPCEYVDGSGEGVCFGGFNIYDANLLYSPDELAMASNTSETKRD